MIQILMVKTFPMLHAEQMNLKPLINLSLHAGYTGDALHADSTGDAIYAGSTGDAFYTASTDDARASFW